MKKLNILILTILIFSFSITPCFALQYTIDEIITNKTVGYLSDSHYDISLNLITYLSSLRAGNNNCSNLDTRYCTILNYYDSFISDYEEIGSSYNYYVLSDLRSDKFKIYYILSDNEIYYQTDGSNHYLKIDSGDIRYFVYNGSFESDGSVMPWNFSQYSNNSTYFNIGGSASNILMSNSDIKDTEGNIIFKNNIKIEEPEVESDGLVIDTLKDFLRWAILPSDDFFTSWKDEQLNKIDELDNVLTYPFALLVRFGDSVLSLDDEQDPRVCWSSIDFSVKDENYHLLDEGCFHFNSILETEAFYNVYVFYILFVKIIFVGMFINLCINKWNSIFNKG